jgi:asparagine synthase (glutamine-hydrolysing)
MPAQVVDRPKMGFAVPIEDWFREGLGDVFRDLVLASDSVSRGFMDAEVGASLLAEHRSGSVSHDARLWSLLMFEVWARRWLAGDSRPGDHATPLTRIADTNPAVAA